MCAARNPLLRLTELAGDCACHVGIGHAVEGVSFAVAPGERVGLIAESDCDTSVTASGAIDFLGGGQRDAFDPQRRRRHPTTVRRPA